MSKKMFKHSLALGALLTFVITGKLLINTRNFQVVVSGSGQTTLTSKTACSNTAVTGKQNLAITLTTVQTVWFHPTVKKKPVLLKLKQHISR